MNNSNTKKYARALTIAGSDSSGGAGIQADLKTFAALGCYGMSVITALTAQNTRTVDGVFEISSDFVAQQIHAVVNDIGVDSIKIGMLNSAEIVQIVSKELGKISCKHIVLDPVMVAKSGDTLLHYRAIKVLKQELLPLASIITPNIPEAEVLLEQKIISDTDIEKAGQELLSLGPQAIMIKGGHSTSQDLKSADLLTYYYKGTVQQKWISEERIQTKNTHGTGCTLSSAIAACLARGFGLLEAVQKSKIYITQAIKTGAAYRTGEGHGPVHHFHEFWNE